MPTKVIPMGPDIITDIQKELFSDTGEPISAWLGSRPKSLPTSPINSSLSQMDESMVVSTPKKAIPGSGSAVDYVTCPKCFHTFNARDTVKEDNAGTKKDQPVLDKVQKNSMNTHKSTRKLVVDEKSRGSQEVMVNQRTLNTSTATNQSVNPVPGVRTRRFTRVYENKTDGVVIKNSFTGISRIQGFQQTAVEKTAAEFQKNVNEASLPNQVPKQGSTEKKMTDEIQKTSTRFTLQNPTSQQFDAQKTSIYSNRPMTADVFQNQVHEQPVIEKMPPNHEHKKTGDVYSRSQVHQELLKIPPYLDQTKITQVFPQNQISQDISTQKIPRHLNERIEKELVPQNQTSQGIKETKHIENRDPEEVAAEKKFAEVTARRRIAQGRVVYQAHVASQSNKVTNRTGPGSRLSEETITSCTPDTSSSSLFSTASSKNLSPDSYYIDLGIEKAPRFDENPCASTMCYNIELKDPKFICTGPADLFPTNRKF